jgi:hypothetical protein
MVTICSEYDSNSDCLLLMMFPMWQFHFADRVMVVLRAETHFEHSHDA